MADKKPSKLGRDKNEYSENIEENLCNCENLNKVSTEKDKIESIEWKYITDFSPKKRMHVKIKNKVRNIYSNLAVRIKEALKGTNRKISSENLIKIQENTFKSFEKVREAGNRVLASRVALKYIVVVGITLVMITVFVQLKLRPVVVVNLDKIPIAVVPDKKSFEGILANLQNGWKSAYVKEIKIKGILSYKLRLLPSRVISTPKQVAEAIESHTNGLIKVKAITVNGKAQVIIKDNNSAVAVLDVIKKKFISKQYENVQFNEDVKIADIYVLPEMVQNEQDAVALLLDSADVVQEYIVKKGDTLWDIADNNNISVEKLVELNPDTGDSLKPGQVIRLAAPKSIINVKTIEYADIKEDTPFETKFQSDPNKVKGERKVLTAGTLGKKLYKVQIIKQNGIEIARNILEEQVIQESKTEVVAVGTKAGALKSATGAFRVPALGSITSRFGYRWGRIHEGVDISGKIGQPIYAADGGKVIFSGVESGYGNLVKIDHGNGYITYYGHCSRLLVKVGQKVSKGEQIALVGNSGHSTGPHLHFEVRKNGKPVDPLKFLK